eukprot:TRINITY_DN2405_c0_g1_i3.p3 TRINITY_DN2405_c0_g1~~TRINITY_DN2405_c0_g1_i3.p3  ORF type:complete len:102 (+),score=6.81 TRINITY_DN2405_c0_g1_i3:161-466(+)
MPGAGSVGVFLFFDHLIHVCVWCQGGRFGVATCATVCMAQRRRSSTSADRVGTCVYTSSGVTLGVRFSDMAVALVLSTPASPRVRERALSTFQWRGPGYGD